MCSTIMVMPTLSDAQRFRDQEETSTQNRAGLLGLRYMDTRGFTAKAPLWRDELPIAEMHQGKLVPLMAGSENQPLVFGITVATPQPLLRQLRDRFQNRLVNFMMISRQG